MPFPPLRFLLGPALVAAAGCADVPTRTAHVPTPRPESVLIRSASSFQAGGSEPIFVVDGIERPAEFLRMVDPDDIVSIRIAREMCEAPPAACSRRRRVVHITTRRAVAGQVEPADTPAAAPGA